MTTPHLLVRSSGVKLGMIGLTSHPNENTTVSTSSIKYSPVERGFLLPDSSGSDSFITSHLMALTKWDASGSADAGSGRLALRLRADGIDMRALLADTTGYDGLHGRARIDADLRSRGGTARALRGALTGRIALTLQPAALRGVDLTRTLSAWRTLSETGSDRVASSASRQTEFSRLSASFELRDGVARSDDLAGDSEFLRVSGEGTVDLAQGRLDYLLRTRVVNRSEEHTSELQS